jgi:hypothetical protein
MKLHDSREILGWTANCCIDGKNSEEKLKQLQAAAQEEADNHE